MEGDATDQEKAERERCVRVHVHVHACVSAVRACNFLAVFLSCWEGQTCSSGSSLQEPDPHLCQCSSGKSVYYGTLSLSHT